VLAVNSIPTRKNDTLYTYRLERHCKILGFESSCGGVGLSFQGLNFRDDQRGGSCDVSGQLLCQLMLCQLWDGPVPPDSKDKKMRGSNRVHRFQGLKFHGC
jgi:hypothetical protein